MKFIFELKERVIRFLHDEEGASAIEYAIVAGVVVLVLAAGITTFYEELVAVFSTIAGNIPDGTTPPPAGT